MLCGGIQLCPVAILDMNTPLNKRQEEKIRRETKEILVTLRIPNMEGNNGWEGSFFIWRETRTQSSKKNPLFDFHTPVGVQTTGNNFQRSLVAK